MKGGESTGNKLGCNGMLEIEGVAVSVKKTMLGSVEK